MQDFRLVLRVYMYGPLSRGKKRKIIHHAHFREEESRFSFLRRRITTDVIRAAINASCRNEARTPRRIFGRRHASVKNLISPCTAVSATALDTGVSPPWARTISALNSSFCRVRPDMCCRFRLVILKKFIQQMLVYDQLRNFFYISVSLARAYFSPKLRPMILIEF